MVENLITSVERLEQYMHIPSEAEEIIQGHRPMHNWPVVGEVKMYDLKVTINKLQKKKKKKSIHHQVLELWKCTNYYYY